VIIQLPQFTIAAPWPLPYAPLTTIFTPPTQCKDSWTLISENTDPSTTSIGQYINLLDTNDSTCLPPGYGRDVWSATFSPGVYCPSGYAIAATGTEVYTALWEKGIYHSPAERSVVCCLKYALFEDTIYRISILIMWVQGFRLHKARRPRCLCFFLWSFNVGIH